MRIKFRVDMSAKWGLRITSATLKAVARKMAITAANATVIAYLVLPHLPTQVLQSLTL
jgi:hypothetical protein